MLTDVIGLAIALTAARLMHRPPTQQLTWGARRAEVLGALAQAALLLGVGIFALVEGVKRLLEPPELASGALLVFGVIGLAANLVGLALLLDERGRNLNMRAAFLEVLNDALGSVGVIVSAVLIWTLGWDRADAVAGILIAALILPRTLLLLRASGRVLLEATPAGLDLAAVREHIARMPGVVAVHDLHASSVSSDLPVLTAHVVVGEGTDYGALLGDLQTCVHEHFAISIEHSTFQLEPEGHRDPHALHE
jgi:cobalt-zinc-cadmium efflux system protein